MAISFFGAASTPADNSSFNAMSAPCVLVPPASMLSNDLVLFLAGLADSNAGHVLSVSSTGGQSWNTLFNTTALPFNYAAYWAQFNGTWSPNPSITCANHTTENTGLQDVMLVFRSNAASPVWAVDVPDSSASYTAPSSPFDVTVPGQTPVSLNTVSVAWWLAESIGMIWALQTGGWSNPGGQAQWRNSSHGVISAAYKINTVAGVATGNVTNRQSSAFAGWLDMVTFTDGSSGGGGGGSKQSYMGYY
jgi:hypothetical protein